MRWKISGNRTNGGSGHGHDSRPEKNPPNRGPLRRSLRLIRRLSLFAALLVAFSLAARLLIADRWFPFNYNYYLPVVLLGPTGILFILASPIKWWRRAVVSFLMLVLWIPSLIKEQPGLFSPPTKTIEKDTFSVMTYNVMAYKLSEKRVLETIGKESPDILCLVEGTFGTWAPHAVVKKLGDDYNWAVGKRLSIATRFPIIKEEQILKTRDITAFKALLDINGTQVWVINLDISPPRRRNDHKTYQLLTDELNKISGPTILTGDFNTPRGSYHLAQITDNWTDCFAQTSQQRFLATWPTIPFPLWQIDHLFCNDQLTPISTRSIQSYGSDHRPIIGKFKAPNPILLTKKQP